MHDLNINSLLEWDLKNPRRFYMFVDDIRLDNVCGVGWHDSNTKVVFNSYKFPKMLTTEFQMYDDYYNVFNVTPLETTNFIFKNIYLHFPIAVMNVPYMMTQYENLKYTLIDCVENYE